MLFFPLFSIFIIYQYYRKSTSLYLLSSKCLKESQYWPFKVTYYCLSEHFTVFKFQTIGIIQFSLRFYHTLPFENFVFLRDLTYKRKRQEDIVVYKRKRQEDIMVYKFNLEETLMLFNDFNRHFYKQQCQ